MSQELMGGREVYFRLMRHVKAHWRPFAVAIFAMVLLGATEPAIPALLQKVVHSFEAREFDIVPWCAAALIGLFILRGLATFSTATGLAAVASRLVATLRERMFDKLLIVPARFYDAHNTGALMSKITYDSTQVTDAATQVVTVLVRDSLAIIGLLAWMFYLDWKLTLVALTSAPVVVFVVKYFSSRLREVSRRMQEVMGEVTHVVEEVTSGQKVVRTFGAQDYERGRFAEAVNKARRFHLRFAATAAANSPIGQLATAITLAIILLIASRQFEAGTITIGGFVSFFTAMGLLFSPIKRLTGINGGLQRGIAAAQSVFQLIDETPEVDSGTRTIGRARGTVEFRNVSFRYETSEMAALDDVSLRIEAGETVALVGPSGSGKTTFANLIPRFYARSAGAITIDDIDINELTLASLRAQIALVSQDVVLFNDTVAANIAYGRKDATDEAVLAAARAAHALEFIEKLPHGFETQIGQRGVRLSGGQRQRLAIARAFYKNAPVLILDEATSALDTESERQVQSALEDLQRNRTTLVIAHRLSSVERADQIAVMENGRILDVGTHSELLDSSPLYANLYRHQFEPLPEHPAAQPSGARAAS